MRLFFAVDLSEEIIERLVRVRDALAETLDDDGLRVRWTPPQNMHVTLKFLGKTDEDDLEEICERAAEAAGSVDAFELAVETLGAFPRPDRPRIFWMGVDNEAAESLATLHDHLEETMAEVGFEPESRSYKPHVTLGRVKDGRAPHLSQIKGKLDAELHEDSLGVTSVDELVLYESTTTSSGAVYDVCETFALGKT